MFVKSLLSNVVSFRGGRTQFYNGKLIAVPKTLNKNSNIQRTCMWKNH